MILLLDICTREMRQACVQMFTALLMYNSLKLKTIPSILGNGRMLAQPCNEINALRNRSTVMSERIQAQGYTYHVTPSVRPEEAQLYIH